MSSVRRRVSAVLVAILVASVMSASPISAQDEPAPPPTDQPGAEEGVGVPLEFEGLADDPLVETASSPGKSRVEVPAKPAPVSTEAGRSGWRPEVAAGALTSDRQTKIGDSPVSVKLGRSTGADRARSVSVNVLERGFSSQLSPFDAAFSIGFRDSVARSVTPSAAYTLVLDLEDVNLGDSGNIAERLTVTRYGACELFEPDLSGIEDTDIDPASVLPRVACNLVDEVDAEFDTETRLLTAVIDEPKLAAERLARRRALLDSGVSATDLDSKLGLVRSSENARGLLDADGGQGPGNNAVSNVNIEAAANSILGGQSVMLKTMILLPHTASSLDILLAQGNSETNPIIGLSSAASSTSGSYASLPVPTLTDGQVGLFTGSAEISYPIPVPAGAAGPSPSVALVYSSASVDGMSMGTNNQTGPVGTGWSLSAGGSIQRGLRGCNTVETPNAQAPGDRCMSGSPDDVYTMSLAGKSSKLIRTNTGTGYPKEFRLQSDPFWRIRLWSGGTANGTTVSTPDHFDEWWSIETPSGTVYTMGSQTQSVDWLPIYDLADCGGVTFALCDRARQWNVDTATDVYGNQMTYEYRQEKNWYNARGFEKSEYIRASHIDTITYGANPGLSKEPNARIVLNHEWRCKRSTDFSNCGEFPAGFNDTPLDLWCGPHAEADEYPTTCGEETPTFWTQLRFSGALSQVTDGSGGWVTVANHDPEQIWERDDPAFFIDSENQLVLNNISERPVDANGIAAGGTYEKYGFDVLYGPDRDSQSGTFINTATHDIGTEATITSLGNGDWIKFDDVWLGNTAAPVDKILLRMSVARTGSVEVRLGSSTGTIIGSKTFVTADLTGGVRDFTTIEIDVTNTSDVHDIVIRTVRPGSTTAVGFLNWVRFTRADILSLPEVAQATFNDGGYDFRDNRRNHPAGTSAMRFPRIKTFTNQLGGTVEYAYGNTQCNTNAVPPGNWSTNTLDCFPQWDTSSAPNGFTVFNKWTVTSMTRGDSFSNQPDVVTTYAYQNAGWGFADNPDSSNDTWSEFRGYDKVTVTDAAGKTEHRFHQGLDGEKLSPSGTRSVSSPRSDGTNIADHYALSGLPYETRRLDGTTEISRDWTVYTNTTTKSGFTDREDPRFVAVSQSDSRVDQSASTRTKFTYNAWGAPLSMNEQGDTLSSTDNRTVVTRYYNPTTTTTLGTWRGTSPCVTATRTGDSTAAPSQTSASGFDRYAQLFFDSNTAQNCGLTINKPNVRRTAVATSSSGRVTTVIQPDNRGRVSITTNPRGYSTTTNYDNLHGQVATTTNNAKSWTSSTGYDVWRRPITSTDINGRVTTTFYDEYSRVTAVRAPVDAAASKDTITYTYSPPNERPAYVHTRRRLDGDDYTSSATFVDGFGRTLQTRAFAPWIDVNWATSAAYDNVGRQKYMSAQYQILAEAVTTYAPPNWGTVPSFTEPIYDAASRVIESHHKKGVGGTISSQFNTKNEYHGFRTRFLNQKGQWTDTTIDGLGRTKNVVEQQSNLTTSFTYSSADDLLTANGPDGLVTSITYDRAGRKLTTDDPDSGNWSYTYNANSSLSSQTDPSGDQSVFTFDELDRPTELKVDTVLRGKWLYDPAGNLGLMRQELQYQNTGGGIVYEVSDYDTYGRKNKEQTLIPEPSTSNLFRFQTLYNLRADGQPKRVSRPSGTWYNSAYHTKYSYNARTGAANILKEDFTGGETIVQNVIWNQAGQTTQHRYGPSGVDGWATWNRDPYTHRLTSSLAGPSTGNWDWQLLQYTYDDNGNVERIYDHYNNFQRQCFTYDKLDRLLTAFTYLNDTCATYGAVGAGSYDDTYTYSPGGNINTKTGTGSGTHNGSYTYGDTNHKHAVTETTDGAQFTYNTDGDMLTRDIPGRPIQTLAWDDGQRLESVTDTNGSTEFLYALDDTRVRRKTGNTYTYYHSGGTEYTHDGTTGTFTYYHQIDGKTVAFTVNGDTTWMYSDQVSSTSMTRTDAGLNSIQRYTPWGETRTSGSLTTDHTFTGQVEDQSTALSFYNARYYDPTVGRFASPDKIIPSPGNGQSYNRYAYVNNNPVLLNDPTGQCPPNRGCGYYVEIGQRKIEGEGRGAIAKSHRAERDKILAQLDYWGGFIGQPRLIGDLISADSDHAVYWLDYCTRNYCGGYGNAYNSEDAAIADLLLAGTPFEVLEHFLDRPYLLDNYATPSGEVSARMAVDAFTNSLLAGYGYPAASRLGSSVSGRLDPNRIRFSQDTASFNFKTGASGTIDDMRNGLRSGTLDPADVEPIRVYLRGGEVFTLDHRRLVAFQEAKVDIPYEWATEAEILDEAWKFTTKNGGTSIRVTGRD
jgi:RHS repeat-associated protein